MTMKIYGDLISGNCLKVKYVCDKLEHPYEWISVDVVGGGARTSDMLAKNPAGQVPFVELSDGRVLSQSNAIMLYIAEGSHLIPIDRYAYGQMHQWLFWEQYSHETAIAVARFHMKFLGKTTKELDPHLITKGNAALDLMENHLSGREWFVGDALSLADIALYAYTQFSHEGGFSLTERPSIEAWLTRVASSIKANGAGE